MPIVNDDHRFVGVVTRSALMRVRDEFNLHTLHQDDEGGRNQR